MSKKLIIKTPITNASEDYLLNLPDKDSGSFTIATTSDVDTAVGAEATARQEAINNAISAEVTNRNTAINTAVNPINAKIPAQASASNQLADKDFVNSSISTNTADFLGTYNVVTDLGLTINATHSEVATKLATLILTPTNNDYTFVSYPDATVSTQFTKFERYKYDGSAWAFEYELNNSSFTAAQWAAINSGATSELINKINPALANVSYDSTNKKLIKTTNAGATTDIVSLNTLKTEMSLNNVDNTSDLNKPISTATQTALNLKADKVGVLPHYNVLSTDNVLDFVRTTNSDKPRVICIDGYGNWAGIAWYNENSPTKSVITLIGLNGNYKISLDEKTIPADLTFADLWEQYGIEFETIDNRVTSISASSTNRQYPTAKLVYDQLALKADKAGPLPSYSFSIPESVLDFITTNNVAGKTIILDDGDRQYIGYFNLVNDTTYDFEIEAFPSGERYVGTNVNMSHQAWAAIINSTYRKDYALDSAVVHKSGNETIAGNKTFSGSNTFSSPVTLTSWYIKDASNFTYGAYQNNGYLWLGKTSGTSTATLGIGNNKVLFAHDLDIQNVKLYNSLKNSSYGLAIPDTTNWTANQTIATQEWVNTNAKNLEEITWANLKAKRDNSELIPGRFYRITDYQCTTTQTNTNSAGNVFDIIVRADDVNKLNEEASAIQHEGDTYFANSNLSAWKLKYCLDNNFERFAWASIEKSVFMFIHRSGTSGDTPVNADKYYRCPELDNKGNKTADGYVWAWVKDDQYYKDANITVYFSKDPDSHDPYAPHWQSTYSTEFSTSMTDLYYDTFRYGELLSSTAYRDHGSRLYKASLAGTTYSDGVGTLYDQAGKGVIYRMIDEFNNDCPYDFKNILFTTSGKYTNAYTFSYTEDSIIKDASLLVSKDCYGNVMKEYNSSDKLQLNFNIFYSTSTTFNCYSNTFSYNCYSNTFSEGCHFNKFGHNCYNNTFGNGCECNTFSNTCYSNIFADYCNYNIFGNNCYSNNFGNSCNQNIFDNYFHSNTFGNACAANTFGNNCYNNTFGNSCNDNIFGNYCNYIIFGTRSGSTNTPADCYYYNIIDSGCQFLCLNASGIASYSNQLQNVHIHSYIKGTPSAYTNINSISRNLSYTTDVYPAGSTEMFI